MSPEESEGDAPISVLGRGVALLRAFTGDDHVLPLAELTRRTSLPKATVHRLAAELVSLDLLDRVPAGYRLSSGLFELGLRAASERTLLEIATPFLQDLYERTHETVHLGVLEGDEVLYVAKIGGHHQTPTPSRVGTRLPLHCTAIGKSLLAHTDDAQRRRVLTGPLERRTPHTVLAPGLLARQLATIRTTSVAYEREESTIGLLCVASPIQRLDGSPAGAVSVAGPVGRFRPERHGAAVRAAASGIAGLLPMGSGS